MALIIDIAGLARRAQLAVEGHEHATSTAARALTDGELHRLLVVRTVDDGRAAITLSGVNRLEELPCSLVERIGAREVVPYRGTILPLGRLSGLLQEKRARRRVPSEPSDVLQIVVHQGRAGPVGIVVERICDIVDVGLAERRPPTRAGVRYTAIIDGRVTEILDMDWLVARVDPVVEAHP